MTNLSDNARLVLTYINEAGPVTNRQIRAAISRSQSAVTLCCRRLQQLELIEFKRRKWQVTFRGRLTMIDKFR